MSTLTKIIKKGQVAIPEPKQATIRTIPGKIVEKLYGSLKTKVKFKGRDYERETTKKLTSRLIASIGSFDKDFSRLNRKIYYSL